MGSHKANMFSSDLKFRHVLCAFVFASHFFLFGLATASEKILPLMIFPSPAIIESGQSRAVLALKGVEAKHAIAIRVVKNGQPIKDVLARLLPKDATSDSTISQDDGHQLIFLTAREGITEDWPLELQVLIDDGNRRTRALPLLLVPAGDPRANAVPLPKSIEEAKQKSSDKKKLIVEQSGVPQVTETQPSPLFLYSDGLITKILMRGNLLEKVNDVRLRPAIKPSRYRNEAGKIKFEFNAEQKVISIELVATHDTKPGTQYAIDLFVDKYLVQTLVATVKDPSEKVLATPDTISLPPAIPATDSHQEIRLP